mgnify:CR=1 FL=1
MLGSSDSTKFFLSWALRLGVHFVSSIPMLSFSVCVTNKFTWYFAQVIKFQLLLDYRKRRTKENMQATPSSVRAYLGPRVNCMAKTMNKSTEEAEAYIASQYKDVNRYTLMFTWTFSSETEASATTDAKTHVIFRIVEQFGRFSTGEPQNQNRLRLEVHKNRWLKLRLTVGLK